MDPTFGGGAVADCVIHALTVVSRRSLGETSRSNHCGPPVAVATLEFAFGSSISMTVNINSEFMSYSPEQAKWTLGCLIEESAHYANCKFKVGMSYDPIGRVAGVSTQNRIPSVHGRLNRTYRWQVQSLTLYILLQTYDYERCQDAERDMIRILRDRTDADQIMNKRDGGGGRKPSKAPYHVYLVRSG